MPIVWTMPDGSVQITQLTNQVLERERRPGETTDQAVLRLAAVVQAKTPVLAGGTPALVKSADIPTDRTERSKWRLVAGRVAPERAPIA